METSNAIIIVETYNIQNLACLGILKTDFEVQVYDFLAHCIFSDYDGVIGHNFLKENKFCVDISKREISVNI